MAIQLRIARSFEMRLVKLLPQGLSSLTETRDLGHGATHRECNTVPLPPPGRLDGSRAVRSKEGEPGVPRDGPMPGRSYAGELRTLSLHRRASREDAKGKDSPGIREGPCAVFRQLTGLPKLPWGWH